MAARGLWRFIGLAYAMACREVSRDCAFLGWCSLIFNAPDLLLAERLLMVLNALVEGGFLKALNGGKGG